jgi:hypothetical protein
MNDTCWYIVDGDGLLGPRLVIGSREARHWLSGFDVCRVEQTERMTDLKFAIEEAEAPPKRSNG